MGDLLSSLTDWPWPAKFGLPLAVAAGVIGVLYWLTGGDWLYVGLILAALLFTALVIGGYILLLKWHRRRKAAPLARDLLGNSAAAPQQISGTKKLADLDALRGSFSGGIEKFRAAGKNLYSLPWYVLVGEPGAGKTEAIRHCNVGFPPGLQDQLQGAGGTINMNWWFTNHAVILDTAGRIMFEEVQAGSSNEWQEFLKLLLKNRPNCPINGMLLVIPADSLIKDTADVIEKKAGKIAQQLDLIQRTLGVRFPVFLLITKSDLITGFSPFFDDLQDPQLQHQILGWSNPAPLDAPFLPEAVGKHLAQVRQRLIERRARLLLDPVHTEDPKARRLDQVDALYAFPESLMKLAPRLRRYLEMIFVAGEWSPKPLFLRGIYFTSSMSEGRALDADLAAALGVAPEALPAEGIWRRDRAYFLRDLFMSKIFPEKGLVSRASNTRRQQRQRKMVVLGLGFAAAAIVAILTLVGAWTLNGSVGNQVPYWNAAKSAILRKYAQIVVRAKNRARRGPRFVFQGPAPNQPGHTIPVAGHRETLPLFYSDGLSYAEYPVHVPLVFRPFALGGNLDQLEHQAYRGLFDKLVLAPIVRAARSKLSSAPARKEAYEKKSPSTKVLLDLLRLQRGWFEKEKYMAVPAVAKPTDATHPAKESPAPPTMVRDCVKYILDPADWQNYHKAGQPTGQHAVKQAMAALYTPAGALYVRDSWPPDSFDPVRHPTFDQDEPFNIRALRRAVRNFNRYWNRRQIVGSQQIQAINKLRRDLLAFQAEETVLFNWANAHQPPANEPALRDDIKAWNTALAALRLAGKTVTTDMANIKFVADGTLVSTYTNAFNAIHARRTKAYAKLRKVARWIKSLPKNNRDIKVQEAMSDLRHDVWSKIKRGSIPLPPPPNVVKQLHDLDVGIFGLAGGKRVFEWHGAMYQAATQYMMHRLLPCFGTPDGWKRIKKSYALFLAKVKNAAGQLDLSKPRQHNRQARQAAVEALRVGLARAVVGDEWDAAPRTRAALEALAKKQASAGPSAGAARPYVLFTRWSKIYCAHHPNFDPAFSSAAGEAVMEQWKSLGAVFKKGWADGGRMYLLFAPGSDFSTQYDQRNKDVFAKYRRKYNHYWWNRAQDALSLKHKSDWPKTWAPAGLHAVLAGHTADDALHGLKRAATDIQTALGERDLQDRHSAGRLAMLQRDLKHLRSHRFRQNFRRLWNRWSSLSADSIKARDRLLRRLSKDPGRFYRRYFSLGAGPTNLDHDSIALYFRSFPRGGLATLANTVEKRMKRALHLLGQNRLFPLAPPPPLGAPRNDLAPKTLQVIAAKLRQAGLLNPPAVMPTISLHPEITKQLQRLSGAILSDAKYKPWAGEAIKIVKLLDPLTCRLEVTGKDVRNNTVQRIWPFARFVHSGRPGPWVNLRNPAKQVFGTFGVPDSPPVELQLYRHPDQHQPPNLVPDLPFHGHWDALWMLFAFNGHPVNANGKVWKVLLSVSQDGQTYALPMHLIFDSPIPKLDQWPSAPGP